MSGLGLKEREAVEVSQNDGRLGGLRHSVAMKVGAVFAVLVGVIGGGGVANAANPSSDLTGGAGDGVFASLTLYFQQHLITSVLALFALLIGVGMLMRWVKRVTSKG